MTTLIHIMTTLQTHNTAQLPLIETMMRNEWYYLNETFRNLDRNDPDVIWAMSERVADIIAQGEGAHMASIVD